MLFTEILLLATKSENLGASWPQGFFMKVKPWTVWMRLESRGIIRDGLQEVKLYSVKWEKLQELYAIEKKELSSRLLAYM